MMQTKRKHMTLEQRIDYLHDLRKMYEKSVRVHGRESQQARSMGEALYLNVGFLRGKIGQELNMRPPMRFSNGIN